MKKSILAIFLCTSLAMFGCTKKQHVTHEGDGHEHSNHGSEIAVNRLSLKNGERWDMDGHTRAMLLKMEKTFFGADHSTQSGLNAAGAKLEKQLDDLIAGCTMHGEAHDQLHIFLSDYIPTIRHLAKAEDYDAARGSAIKLKGQLEMYKKYFK